MSDVFIAHVEEDAEVSLEIALGLEEAGYTTWCYEVDSIPGPSYLIQTGQAVEEARALTLVISPHSLGSRQVTKEIVRAHETGKEFVPVLRDISHIEFQNRQPEWREALGAASSVRIPLEGVSDIIPRIVSGLKASGVLPKSKPEAAHIARIRKTLGEIQRYRMPDKSGEPLVPAAGLELEAVTEEPRPARSAEEALWRKMWVRLTLAAFVVIAASIVGVLLINQSGPGSSSEDMESTQTTSVTFVDSNLGSAIDEAIHKAAGPVAISDLESLTVLSAAGRNISDLTGLEHCANLETLHIYENNISDITPLIGLTSLRELYIYKNSISDISPLAGLTGLEELWLGRNNIGDISPLAGLTNLNVLILVYNNITDISLLVENEGLSSGDTVNLLGNPLSATSLNVYIPQLEQRGVSVQYYAESIGRTYELGLALLSEGRYQEAIVEFDKVIDVDADNAEAYYNRGLAYYYSGEYEQAILDLTEAINLDPGHASAYNFRGDAYISLGEYDTAIADFTTAINLSPDYQYAYHDRSLAYYYKEEWNNAIADVTRAIEIDPDDARFYYLRGFIYIEMGMDIEAIADFEKCIAITQDPSLIQGAQEELQELR